MVPDTADHGFPQMHHDTKTWSIQSSGLYDPTAVVLAVIRCVWVTTSVVSLGSASLRVQNYKKGKMYRCPLVN